MSTRGVFAAPEPPQRAAALHSTSSADGTVVPALDGSPSEIAATLRATAEQDSFALGILSEPFPTEDYLEFGRTLGDLHPEKAPQIQDRVQKGYVLNLTATEGADASTDRQPFSQAPLLAHTESSAAPVERQPRYITLMCLEPGDPDHAQTLVIPMGGVLARLGDEDKAILRTVRYDRDGSGPILRTSASADVLAFRDFGDEPLAWRSEQDLNPERVGEALRRLTDAIYAAPRTTLRWRRGLLVLLDNHRAFHARTAGEGTTAARRRHLQRLRGLDR